MVLRHVALDLVDLMSELLLASSLFVQFGLEPIKLGIDLRLWCAVGSAPSILLASHLVPHSVDPLLLINVAGRKLARSKDSLADVLRVVRDSRIQIFTEDHGCLMCSNFAVIVSENGVQEMLFVLCLITDHLLSTK